MGGLKIVKGRKGEVKNSHKGRDECLWVTRGQPGLPQMPWIGTVEGQDMSMGVPRPGFFFGSCALDRRQRYAKRLGWEQRQDGDVFSVMSGHTKDWF